MLDVFHITEMHEQLNCNVLLYCYCYPTSKQLELQLKGKSEHNNTKHTTLNDLLHLKLYPFQSKGDCSKQQVKFQLGKKLCSQGNRNIYQACVKKVVQEPFLIKLILPANHLFYVCCLLLSHFAALGNIYI